MFYGIKLDLNKMVYSFKTSDNDTTKYIKCLVIKSIDIANNVINKCEYSLVDLFDNEQMTYFYFNKIGVAELENNCIILNFYALNTLLGEYITVLNNLNQFEDEYSIKEKDLELLEKEGYIYLCKYGYYKLTLKSYFVLYGSFPLFKLPDTYFTQDDSVMLHIYERFFFLLMIRETYGWREEI